MRLNFTGRKKIPRKQVRFELHAPDDDGFSRFDATLHLEGLGLPDDASVYVEAYHKASFMRFGYGCVGELNEPEDRRLTELRGNDIVYFRVKVVRTDDDIGRMVAACDGVAPVRAGDAASGASCLLHVSYVDLGKQIWRMDLDGQWPSIELNVRLAPTIGLTSFVVQDLHFFSLVLPAAMRAALERAIFDPDGWDGEVDDGTWQSQWIEFAERLEGVERWPERGSDSPSSRSRFWIEDAVAAFCRRHDMVKLLLGEYADV